VGVRISQKVAVGVVFVAALFMSILDATIVNVALPTLGRDFGTSIATIQWVPTIYLLAFATPPARRNPEPTEAHRQPTAGQLGKR
jgi:MFS family permease